MGSKTRILYWISGPASNTEHNVKWDDYYKGHNYEAWGLIKEATLWVNAAAMVASVFGVCRFLRCALWGAVFNRWTQIQRPETTLHTALTPRFIV